jgi:TonB family protein
MKKLLILAAFFCLLLSGAVLAQDKTADFNGTWELDLAKSKLPETMRLESGMLVVTQTDRNLNVATDFKRVPRPEGDNNGGGGMRQGRMGGGGGRGAGMLGNGTTTYNLDGNETIVESETPNGMPPTKATLKAKAEKDGKLKLNSTRTFNGQMGEMTIKTVETWELLDGGKTLKVTRDTESPRGSQTAEMYFTKKDSTGTSYKGSVGTSQGIQGDYSAQPKQTGKIISGGVLNGKASKLVAPEYPPAAMAVGASGTVVVQVTIDEQGKIISATAVSGHPLLKAAAEQAARKAEFAPTQLQGVPVKVTGVITYNFIL